MTFMFYFLKCIFWYYHLYKPPINLIFFESRGHPFSSPIILLMLNVLLVILIVSQISKAMTENSLAMHL